MILDEFAEQGFARVPLGPTQQVILARLYDEVTEFSRAEQEWKDRLQELDLTNGYRPLGAAHAGDPDQVDFNDSFIYWWPRKASRALRLGEVKLINALESYRLHVCIPVMLELINELHAFYWYANPLPFELASFLQFNSFHIPTDRELLQTPHEDGVLATVIWTSAAGLEAFPTNEAGIEQLVPITMGTNEVAVMPGGILDLMTGGEFPALFHQARNHRVSGDRKLYDPERKSIMYFSSLEPGETPIVPFVRNELNDGVDIGKRILASAEVFGAPAGFYRK